MLELLVCVSVSDPLEGECCLEGGCCLCSCLRPAGAAGEGGRGSFRISRDSVYLTPRPMLALPMPPTVGEVYGEMSLWLLPV